MAKETELVVNEVTGSCDQETQTKTAYLDLVKNCKVLQNSIRIETEQLNINKRTTSKRCSYCYVYQSTVPGKKYFRFPRDLAMCKKWVLACERPFLLNKTVYQLHQNYSLCSDHFRPSDYSTSKMCRLKPTAYPQFNSEPASVKISDDCNLITKMRHNLSKKLNILEDKESDITINSSDVSTVIAVLTSTPMPTAVSEDVPATHHSLEKLEIPSLWLPQTITKDAKTVTENMKLSERRFCSVARKKIRKVNIDSDPICSTNSAFNMKEKQQETDAEALLTMISSVKGKLIPVDENEVQNYAEKASFHQPYDSEDIFGQYVASEIRTLKDDYLLYLKTKQSILKILACANFQLIHSK